MPSLLPGQLAYETLAHGPAARAQRAADALAAARKESRIAGDRWMRHLIGVGLTTLVCVALSRHRFVPAAATLAAFGTTLAMMASLRWHGTRLGAATLGLAAHVVGWALSVQLGLRIEWGAATSSSPPRSFATRTQRRSSQASHSTLCSTLGKVWSRTA